ncbi:GNAT family N-acetyltransferase [Yeosuana sp. MJ-SS3]|jgi:phosphinothricin acetyltransferase|uniref:GNAT family N-acetyltransferase n=1 Tax=Gilvirhabdus luticola TaxID=3079858 RepID=A0ABU3U4Q0_9FLAO|nr:N-acetyltransferase family protein [Yeosuana sp. MJ-SS3]MDU8885336.1 GNAT family N-acetyltransferase [Yeosuana sp. MJ-SS3]
MSTSIRQAEEKDIPKILEIINFEILNSTVIYDYLEHTIEQQTEWFKQKQKKNMPVIVAECNDGVIGFGTYSIFRPWDAYRLSLEHSIYVDKDYRSQGIGRTLMTELIKLAKDQGYHTMIAGVDASNQKSVNFHKHSGFKEVGVFKEVGYKFDKWLDLIFMQLFLND